MGSRGFFFCRYVDLLIWKAYYVICGSVRSGKVVYDWACLGSVS